MDLSVPGGWGGKETFARLRKMAPAVKAIVSSGYSSDPIMVQYFDFGFMAVLEKPYRIMDLSSVLAGLF
jgi:CheY-like chemotaxis protein